MSALRTTSFCLVTSRSIFARLRHGCGQMNRVSRRHQSIKHFINNQSVSSSGSFEVKNASDQSLIHKVANIEDKIIEDAVTAASNAFPQWAATSFAHRRTIFLKACALLEQQVQHFTEVMSKETPTSPTMAAFNVNFTLSILQELASTIRYASKGELQPTSDGGMAHVLWQPYGVCLSMAPWNCPLLLACRAIATPIIAGNTVVFKSSEVSPATHALFGNLFREAGLPDGVLNVIHAASKDAPSTVERLVSDPRIRHVNFTGSTRVGSIIAALAGKYIKPVILELGGKAPAIVLADADLDIAASNVILGAWMHQGQICMSTEKAIVHADVYDAFVERCRDLCFSSELRRAPLGHAMPSGATRARELIDDAIQRGAKLLLDTKSNEEATITPCILTDVTPSMQIYTEETFSPVFLIMKAATDDEAIRLANDTSFGLSSAIFSQDVYRAAEMAKRLDAAATHINSLTVSDDPSVPHGGNKMSGHGRFNGVHGIRSFLQTKVITVHGQGQIVPV